MDIGSALLVLRRHWVAVLAGLMLTGVGLGVCLVVVPPTYTVSAQSLLLVPIDPTASANVGSQAEDRSLQNPYLAFDLTTVAEIVAKSMNTPAKAEALAAAGGTEDYLVDLVPGDAPIISITVTSPSSDRALSTAGIVTQSVVADLTERQDTEGASITSRIVLREVAAPDTAVKSGGPQLRALAGVAVLGLALTVLLAFILEGLAERRRRSEQAKPGQHAEGRTEPGARETGADLAPTGSARSADHDAQHSVRTNPSPPTDRTSGSSGRAGVRLSGSARKANAGPSRVG